MLYLQYIQTIFKYRHPSLRDCEGCTVAKDKQQIATIKLALVINLHTLLPLHCAQTRHSSLTIRL